MDPRKLLHPWRQAFRRLRVVDDGDDIDDVLWLDFGSYGRTNQVAGFTMEGLELLMWLARVSVDQLQAVVADLWPERKALERAQFYCVSRYERIGIWLRMDTYSYLAGLGYTSPTLPPLTASREYMEARTKIQQVLLTRSVSAVDSLPKPEILVHAFRYTSAGRVFFKTLPLIPDAMKRWLDTEDHAFHLRVTKLTLSRDPMNLNDHKVMAQLNELTKCGVRVVGGHVTPVNKSSKRTALTTFTDLQSLLQTHTQAVGGVDDLSIIRDDANLKVLPGLFSALTTTRSLRRLSIASYADAELNAIESIGLAVCSSLARHRIESVALKFFRDRGLQRLLRALGRTDDPLAIVYNDHAASIRAHQHLRATSSRFALYDPTTNTKKKNVVVDTHEHTELRIIDYKRPWWCVLLPAWDEAWVHDDDVTITTIPAVAVAHVGNPNIRKIEVVCFQSQVGDVTALVKAMNPRVEDLTLSVVDATAPDDAGANFVSSFPHLRRLSLDVSPRHLAPLVRVVASLGASRALATLALGIDFESHELDLLGDFIGILTNPNHAVSQCLESWDVEGRLEGSADAVDELTRQFALMLNTNKRLTTIQFIAWADDVVAAASQKLKRSLLAHNGTLVPVQNGALGRRQKLAFLSTMPRASLDRERAGVRLLLDSEMVSLVFGFAAPCRHRTVDVRITGNT